MKERSGLFFFAWFLLWSCATPPKPSQVELPAFVLPLFSNCKNSDGASGLRLFNGTEFLGSAELEFVVGATSEWQIRISDTMGPEILTMQSPKTGQNFVTVLGPMADRVPRLEALNNGFLEVDGRFSGIRVDEVPCVASLLFPLEWMKSLKSVRRNDGKVEALVDDGIRRIELSFYKDPKRANTEACARIQSSSWLSSLRAKWKLCIGAGSKAWATLDGFNGYVMKWNSYD